MAAAAKGAFAPLIVKICGVTTPEAARAAIDAGAAMLGLVFFEKSPRAIAPEAGAALVAQIRAAGGAQPLMVGLFVDADDAAIAAAAPYLDIVQCHGAETPARVAAIKERFGLPVMKALPVAAAGDLEAAKAFDGGADAFLFDARPPKGSDVPGGHGAVFDWSLLKAYDGQTPFLLAGGLTLENAGEAVAALKSCTAFAGVDVSSGVERVRGVKDVGKIRAFTCAALAAFGAGAA